MEKLLNGADGLVARAPKGTIQEKAYNFLAAKVKVGCMLGWLCLMYLVYLTMVQAIVCVACL
jgi:hypothetical protein